MSQPVDVRVHWNELVIVAAPYPQLPLCAAVELVRQQYDEKMILFFSEYLGGERNLPHNACDLLRSSDERPDIFRVERPSHMSRYLSLEWPDYTDGRCLEHDVVRRAKRIDVCEPKPSVKLPDFFPVRSASHWKAGHECYVFLHRVTPREFGFWP